MRRIGAERSDYADPRRASNLSTRTNDASVTQREIEIARCRVGNPLWLFRSSAEVARANRGRCGHATPQCNKRQQEEDTEHETGQDHRQTRPRAGAPTTVTRKSDGACAHGGWSAVSSQTELADRIGVTFQQVQKYEKGVNRIGAGRLQRISEALEVPISFFFGGQPGGASKRARREQRRRKRVRLHADLRARCGS